jgi:hypothetical protein
MNNYKSTTKLKYTKETILLYPITLNERTKRSLDDIINLYSLYEQLQIYYKTEVHKRNYSIIPDNTKRKN